MDDQFFNDFEEMFATNGWRRMVKDAESAIRDRESAALQAKNIEDVYFMRGEATQLSIIISLEQAMAMLKAQYEEDQEEE
jgi:hypothetical protein